MQLTTDLEDPFLLELFLSQWMYRSKTFMHQKFLTHSDGLEVDSLTSC